VRAGDKGIRASRLALDSSAALRGSSSNPPVCRPPVLAGSDIGDICPYADRVRYEWDPAKAAANLAAHGVSRPHAGADRRARAADGQVDRGGPSGVGEPFQLAAQGAAERPAAGRAARVRRRLARGGLQGLCFALVTPTLGLMRKKRGRPPSFQTLLKILAALKADLRDLQAAIDATAAGTVWRRRVGACDPPAAACLAEPFRAATQKALRGTPGPGGNRRACIVRFRSIGISRLPGLGTPESRYGHSSASSRRGKPGFPLQVPRLSLLVSERSLQVPPQSFRFHRSLLRFHRSP